MSFPVVIVSGWSMPATVLEPLAEALDGDGRASVVQLPGLVEEPGGHYDWQALLNYLDLHLLEMPAILVGWSLGGILATLYASQNPGKVASLVTLASNPCFVRRDDWPEAMLPQTFESFYAGMQESPEATVSQFAMLCSMGNSNRKEVLEELKRAIAEDMDLDAAILLQELKLLGESDMRSQLGDIRCPVIHFYGKDDALVPAGTGEQLELHYPSHAVNVLSGGHCFFLENDNLNKVVEQVVRLCSRS